MEITKLSGDHFYFYHKNQCLSINFVDKLYKFVTLEKGPQEIPATPEQFYLAAKRNNFTLDILENVEEY